MYYTLSSPLVCKFYCHSGCKELAFNNCKQCATYSFSSLSTDSHHWIEGNLPSSARCQVCTKSCTSTDCLTGFRCGWCGIAVSEGVGGEGVELVSTWLVVREGVGGGGGSEGEGRGVREGCVSCYCSLMLQAAG